MKKIYCFSLICWFGMFLYAQPAGHFRQGDHHIDKVEHLVAKNGYTHRLASYRTSDDYQICNFFYNSNGRLVAIKDSVRNDYSLIDSLTYDHLGQIVRMSGWQLLNGVWENVYVIYYEYDEEGNRISRTNYNNFDGVWELGGVYNYSYDSYGNVVLSELTMGGIVFQKVEYTYSSAGGDLVCELWYGYNGSRLFPSEKIVTVWVDGKKDREYDSVSDDGVHWRFNGRSEFFYDESGNCTEYHHYDNTGSEVERNIYDINTELPLSQTFMPWTPETTRPKTYQNVHAYDREAWYAVDVDHVLRYVCDYLYEYEETTAGIRTTETLEVSVFPNPSHGFVTLRGVVGRVVAIRVMDVMGRTVMTSEIKPDVPVIDVQSLVPGCYVMQIVSDGGMSSVRLVIE